MDYGRWRFDRVFLLVPAQQFVGKFLATFKEFPPSQTVGSFSLDQVMKQLSEQVWSLMSQWMHRGLWHTAQRLLATILCLEHSLIVTSPALVLAVSLAARGAVCQGPGATCKDGLSL